MNRDDLFWSGVAWCLLPWILMAALLYRARERKAGSQP